MTTKSFNDVLNTQVAQFLESDKQGVAIEQAKMANVYTIAQAMKKGSFKGFFDADGKKIGAKDKLYTLGQILDYCQRFVDNGKQALLLESLKNSDGSFIGLRKAKDYLPTLGREKGMASVFPKRNTSASHAEKTNKAEKPTEVVTVDLTQVTDELLDSLNLAQLGYIFDMVQNAMQAKMLGTKTPSEKPTKTAARKQATA